MSETAAANVRNGRARFGSLGVFALCVILSGGGCTEVKGRRLIQQGNELYRDAKYPEAVHKFEEAAQLIPNFPTLWLNKGYTCKRMIIPGSRTPESAKAADCAIEAFDKFKKLSPDDSRGDMLYTQTLFDADRFETLAGIYEDRFKQDPKDEQAVTVLMQVFAKWDTLTLDKGGKLNDALRWYVTHLEQRPQDPEAYYGVGTFIYSQLAMKGGGPAKMCWDPRPGAKNNEKCLPPADAYGDLVGAQRSDLADQGIQYLEKAIELRPTYTDAMTYINLLWRQKSYAYFSVPDEWWSCMQKAEEWKFKTLEILRQRGVPMAQAMPREAVAAPAKSMEEVEEDLSNADEEGTPDVAAGAGAKKKSAAATKSKGKSHKGKGKRR